METLLGNYPIGSKQSRAANKDARQNKRADRKQVRKEDDRKFKEKVGDKAKTVFWTPSRVAFLGLIRINFLGMADILNIPNDPRMSAEKKAQIKPLVERVYKTWFNKFGGNRTALAEVIAKGAKERAFGFNIPIVKNLKFVKKMSAAGAVGGYHNKDIGLGFTGAELAAAIKSAIPIIKSIVEVLLAIISVVGAAKLVKTQQTGQATTPDIITPDTTLDTTPGGATESKAGYGLIGLAALAAIYFGTMSKGTKRKK